MKIILLIYTNRVLVEYCESFAKILFKKAELHENTHSTGQHDNCHSLYQSVPFHINYPTLYLYIHLH